MLGFSAPKMALHRYTSCAEPHSAVPGHVGCFNANISPDAQHHIHLRMHTVWGVITDGASRECVGSQAVRHTNLTYAVFPYKKATFPRSSTEELARLVDDCMTYAVGKGLCPPGKEVVVISGVTIMSVAMSPSVAVRVRTTSLLWFRNLRLQESDFETTL
jgi:hypothetical protein